MIFEDAHWADPTSLELFSRVVERIAAVRVLLIVTFRPEFEPPWIGRPHVTALTINRLVQRDIDAMIDRVVGNKPPSGERAVDKTGAAEIYAALTHGAHKRILRPRLRRARPPKS
jgi:predicted ATPase